MGRFEDVSIRRARARCYYEPWGGLVLSSSQIADRAQAILASVGIEVSRVTRCELMVKEAELGLAKIALDNWFELVPRSDKPVKVKEA